MAHWCDCISAIATALQLNRKDYIHVVQSFMFDKNGIYYITVLNFMLLLSK